MIDYLIVMLEDNCPSFCHYERGTAGDNRLMPLEVLKGVVDHAIRNAINVNFLCGTSELPPEYAEVMGTIDHISMASFEHSPAADFPMPIIDLEEYPGRPRLPEAGHCGNIIVRAGKNDLGSLAAVTGELLGSTWRVNIILKEIETFSETEFDLYRGQLAELRVLMEERYKAHNFVELNVVSDRIYLTNMNNCDAGVRHLTVAPNGKLYLCPAFYYENEQESLGDLLHGTPALDDRLLRLDYAPACRNCDAYHCKRCVYLNRKLTAELNTPSRQQCVIAHMERDASRQFLDNVAGHFQVAGEVPPIAELAYLDPLELLADRSVDPEWRERHFAELLAGPLAKVPVEELLHQIYLIDQTMLTRLKDLNYRVVNFLPEGEGEER